MALRAFWHSTVEVPTSCVHYKVDAKYNIKHNIATKCENNVLKTQNRKVLRRFLNVLTVSADLTSDGKLFQAGRATMQKARSPRQRRRPDMNRSLLGIFIMYA